MSSRLSTCLLASVALVSLIVVPLAGAASQPVPSSTELVESVPVADAPLVADAGDTAYVAPGQFAALLGDAYGGTAPYTFTWSADGVVLESADGPSAAADTTELTTGRYTVTLQATDATGATATDTVDVVVEAPEAGQQVLDETVTADAPGAANIPPGPTYEVEVPAGTGSLSATITWTVPTNDYDVALIDPDGNEATLVGDFVPDTEETAVVADPAPGTWTVEVHRFATAGEPSLTVTAELLPALAGDPRPALDTGGPYRFDTTEPQTLDATVTGGAAPLTVGWDTDQDGRPDVQGEDPTLDLLPGRHFVTLRVTDADGNERQRMTTVHVGTTDDAADQTIPITVIGIADTGINPYHSEFSAATYPDPEVLALTRNFTRHPSEYIPGYPADAPALPITTGDQYFPGSDRYLWEGNEFVEAGKLYWIPGTKIVGAVDAGGSTGATSGDDPHPLLDDNGHGTGSSSVSAGNRYGYCPTCLLVHVEALDESVVSKYDWIDISSNSFGYVGGLPVGYAVGPSAVTKAAVERGQTVLFAAGNGVGNTFFDVPVLTYGSDQTGPDWNISVGAIREDSQEAIIADGIPVHVSNLGDGDLPSACRVGVIGQCAFGGTSAATPYTAGVFGTVLDSVRQILGDDSTGQQYGQQVVAKGRPVEGSPYLGDGELTRRELRAAVLKTSVSRSGDFEPNRYVLPQSYEGAPLQVLFEGYGVAGPASAMRAVEVLLGERAMPLRTDEDAFFAEDCQARDAQYESYDRDGDGQAEGCEEHIAVDEAFLGDGEATNDDPRATWFDAVRDRVAEDQPGAPITYYLHRVPRLEPTREPTATCAESDNEMLMSREDSSGDAEPCFDSRITSTVAAFRPKGIFAATDVVTDPVPAGSTVDVTLYVQVNQPTAPADPDTGAPSTGGPFEIIGVLKATDREVGRSAPQTGAAPPATWQEVSFSFETERNVAAGEQLTVQFQVAGAQSYAYGYEDDHASVVTVTPASTGDGQDFGVTIDEVERAGDLLLVRGSTAFVELGDDPQLAGFHPNVHAVQVAYTDDFAAPSYARVDPETGTWHVSLPAAASQGSVHARALFDRFPSDAVQAGAAAAAPSPSEPAGRQLPATGGGLALVALSLLGTALVGRRARRR